MVTGSTRVTIIVLIGTPLKDILMMQNRLYLADEKGNSGSQSVRVE